MLKEDLYIVAYERIKSKPGNMTAASDGDTLDGFSHGDIQEIIQAMRTEQFHFKPVRQQFITEPNGKMRKLGIPTEDDELLPEEGVFCHELGLAFGEVRHGSHYERGCTEQSRTALPIDIYSILVLNCN